MVIKAQHITLIALLVSTPFLFHSAKSQQCLDFVLGENSVAALNEALKSELQRLKVATGQMGNQMMMNFAGPPHAFGGGNQQVFHHPSQAMPPFLAMQQQQQQHPNQPLHPLQTQQQLQQAALSLNMKGPAAVAPPGQWQWGGGDAWSESSSS
jgi:hypothetical protein